MTYRRLNQRGISLVQMVVAMGISTLTAMGVAGVIQNMSAASRSADVRMQLEEELLIVTRNLRSEENCNNNFRGETVTQRAEELQKRMTIAPGHGNASGSSRFIIPSQAPDFGGRLEVNDVKIRRMPASASVAMLELTFSEKNNASAQPVVREIPLHVEYSKNDSNRIARCSTARLIAEAEEEPDFVEQDPPLHRKQGNACRQTPPEASNQQGLPHNGAPLSLSAQEMDQAIDSICRQQSYPVRGGIEISRSAINDCLNNRNQPRNTRCMAIIDLAFAETSRGDAQTASGPVRVKNRTGYADVAECRAQRAYSEGDVVRREGTETGTRRQNGITTTVNNPSYTQFSCVGGHWVVINREPASVTKVYPDLETLYASERGNSRSDGAGGTGGGAGPSSGSGGGSSGSGSSGSGSSGGSSSGAGSAGI